MIGGGLHSPLLEELRVKRGLVYYVGCTLFGQNDTNGNIIISTQSNAKNINDIKKVTEDVMNNKDKFITNDVFMITKNNLVVSKEKSQIFNFGAIDDSVYENIHVHNFIDNITFEDCQRVFDKYFNFDNWKISVDKDDFGGAMNESKQVVKGTAIKLFENKTLKI
jgi:predicted Zn-dependent peptidase